VEPKLLPFSSPIQGMETHTPRCLLFPNQLGLFAPVQDVSSQASSSPFATSVLPLPGSCFGVPPAIAFLSFHDTHYLLFSARLGPSPLSWTLRR